MSTLLTVLVGIIGTFAFECFDDEETCKILAKEAIQVISESDAVPGRDTMPFEVSPTHVITGNSMLEPFPTKYETAMFGMGCFWSSEHVFYDLHGVFSTQVGYAGGYTKNPTYKEVKENKTGHIEVVRIIFDPNIIEYKNLLKLFWEKHNPCQGMRQG